MFQSAQNLHTLLSLITLKKDIN